jgi:hypothetical protein
MDAALSFIRRTAGRVADGLGRVPVALLIVVTAGLLLRIALSLAYAPTYLTSYDTALYVDVANGELFSDVTRPVGYPLFLRALHTLSDAVSFTVQVQHLIGIACGLLLYATVRRVGAPIWVGVVSAAAVVLPLDQIFLEHILMAEAPFELAFFAALYFAVRALDPPRSTSLRLTTQQLWIIGAGLALGLSLWLRTTSLGLIPFFALWFAFAMPGSWRLRAGRAAICVAAAGLVVVGYMSLSASYGSGFTLGNSSGWALYGRVAPFADCTRFEPPAGTEALCETTPAEDRYGSDFYSWQPESPAMRIFRSYPNEPREEVHRRGNEELRAFAQEALVNQPLSYAEDVGRDLIRYFDPGFQDQPFSGYGYNELDVELRPKPDEEAPPLGAINSYYVPTRVDIGDGIRTLGEIQDIVRVHPKLLALAILLGIVGLVAGRGIPRSGVALLLGTALIQLIVPVATVIWSSRYAVPVNGPLVASAALGVWLAVRRFGPHHQTVDSMPSSSSTGVV